MDRAQFFVFYHSNSVYEKYQFPFRKVGDKIHYFNYTEERLGITRTPLAKEYWEFMDSGVESDSEFEGIWPEEEIISANQVDIDAKRRLVEFIMEMYDGN